MSKFSFTSEEESLVILAQLEAQKRATAARREQFEKELRELEEKEANERRRLEAIKRQKEPRGLTQKEQIQVNNLKAQISELQTEIDSQINNIMECIAKIRKLIAEGDRICFGTKTDFPVSRQLPETIINVIIPNTINRKWNKLLGL